MSPPNSIKHPLSKSGKEDIGNTEPVCPQCGWSLDKMPSRKMKCPSCSGFIYVRTRPSDGRKVLVTMAQAELIKEQWSVENGTHDIYLKKKLLFEEEKATIAARFGCKPSDNDVKWSLFNKQIIENARRGDWGLYRNTKLNMAELLRMEGRLKDALNLYLEICYIDLNGPRNTGGYSNLDILRKYPLFSPEQAFLAPGVLVRIISLKKKLKLDLSKTKEYFGLHP